MQINSSELRQISEKSIRQSGHVSLVLEESDALKIDIVTKKIARKGIRTEVVLRQIYSRQIHEIGEYIGRQSFQVVTMDTESLQRHEIVECAR